jgi:hypothetical protein
VSYDARAFYIEGGKLNIEKSDFINLYARQNGGAIYNINGNFSVEGSIFNKN